MVLTLHVTAPVPDPQPHVAVGHHPLKVAPIAAFPIDFVKRSLILLGSHLHPPLSLITHMHMSLIYLSSVLARPHNLSDLLTIPVLH